VQGLAQGKQLKDLLANLSVASDHLATAADRLPPLLAALQATARRADNGTADLEASLAPILRDTAAAVANLREMTEALRQAPGQVLFSAPPPRERRTSP
jgi:ABC-type transporter Mla subunit MlaD